MDSGSEVAAIVRAEIDDRLAAADGCPPGTAADRLRAEAEVLADIASEV